MRKRWPACPSLFANHAIKTQDVSVISMQTLPTRLPTHYIWPILLFEFLCIQVEFHKKGHAAARTKSPAHLKQLGITTDPGKHA